MAPVQSRDAKSWWSSGTLELQGFLLDTTSAPPQLLPLPQVCDCDDGQEEEDDDAADDDGEGTEEARALEIIIVALFDRAGSQSKETAKRFSVNAACGLSLSPLPSSCQSLILSSIRKTSRIWHLIFSFLSSIRQTFRIWHLISHSFLGQKDFPNLEPNFSPACYYFSHAFLNQEAFPNLAL